MKSSRCVYILFFLINLFEFIILLFSFFSLDNEIITKYVNLFLVINQQYYQETRLRLLFVHTTYRLPENSSCLCCAEIKKILIF